MSIEQTRRGEVAKYARAYEDAGYRLGERRRQHIEHHLNRIPRGSLLDVSTGRGEVLHTARDMGFAPVMGTEAVAYLCAKDRGVVHALAHDLPFPDNAFDIVTMFDVMEHLPAADTGPACRELARVARRRVLLTVHNGPHRFKGMDLHINRRASYACWHADLSEHFAPYPVMDHGKDGSISAMYEVLLDQ